MKITATDKKALIRLAASLPAGSQDRRAILRMASEPVDSYELEAALHSFSGGGGYIKAGFPPIHVTRGVEYLCEKAQSWWLVDVIASHQTSRRVAAQPFQVWHLKKSGQGASVWADDGNGKKIASQQIPNTDFPLPAIKLYCTRNPGERPIVMLPGEY